jgi:hypothetical protein
MDANSLFDSKSRPLIGQLENLANGDRYERNQPREEETPNDRLVQLMREFFRGDKEKRRRLMSKADPLEALKNQDQNEEGSDKYEPQRITRKIHWQYDGSMKKVPMLRRNYIG